MRLRLRVAGIAALLAAGCGAPSTGPKTSEGRADAAGAESVAPVPLRRLTRDEYNNTVRDLLADASRPADAFPPDEAVGGFESNNVAPVTTALVERYMGAAEELAERAKPHIHTLAPCGEGEPHAECARRFVETFGRRAFRRPLDEEELSRLVGVFATKEARSDYAGGIQLVIATMLQSPQFLYRIEPDDRRGGDASPLSPWEVATRLSYFVWASAPDDALLDEAAAGKLATTADVDRAARRLLADPRAVEGIRSFHRQWLGLTELETASKEATLTTALTPELKNAMIEETLRFSTHAVLAGGDVVSTLLTSPRSYVNGPLAKLYGVPAPAEGFALTELPAGQRSGVLTHASVMTVHSNADQTSPILRGKFVRERLLCQPIPPPPPNTNITPPSVDPKKKTKERFLQHRRDPSCASCHDMMDPIGFGFEHYDILGAWRTQDGDFAVDAEGELSTTGDADGAFDGALELGRRLAASTRVRRCVATQWFRYAMGRSDRDEDSPSIDEAYRAFAGAGFDVRELVVAIAKTRAFRYASSRAGGEN